jgi:hypothetical protein
MDSVVNAENTENQTTAQWQKYMRTPPAPNCAKASESLLETRLRMKHNSMGVDIRPGWQHSQEQPYVPGHVPGIPWIHTYHATGRE